MVTLIRKSVITEAKQVGKLYHVAALIRASKICESDSLGVDGHSYFTRDQNFNIVSHHYKKVYLSVRFTVDGDKLSENYKVDPVNNHVSDGDIQWEVLVNRNIKDFHKYVTAIDIMADTNCFRLPSDGSWGKAKANLDLVIKDPDFNKYNNIDKLLDSIKEVQSYSKKYSIPLGVLNAKFSVPTIVKALKNYSPDNSLDDSSYFMAQLLAGLKTNFSRDFSIREFKDSTSIKLTDSKDKNHTFTCIYNPDTHKVSIIEKNKQNTLWKNSDLLAKDPSDVLWILNSIRWRIKNT